MYTDDSNNNIYRESPRKKKRFNLFAFILFLIVMGLAATAGFFYWKTKRVEKFTNPVTQDQLQMTLEKVGKIAILPDGEIPKLAVISDPSALKSEKFFDKAKIGDKLLIYSTAQKAILYSESENKIVEMMTLSFCPAPGATGGTDVISTSSSTQ